MHYYFPNNSTNLQNIFKFQATTNSTNFLVTYETKRDDLKHQTIWKKRTGNCRGFFKAAASETTPRKRLMFLGKCYVFYCRVIWFALFCVFFWQKNDLYGMAVATFSDCDLRNSPWIFIVIRNIFGKVVNFETNCGYFH